MFSILERDLEDSAAQPVGRFPFHVSQYIVIIQAIAYTADQSAATKLMQERVLHLTEAFVQVICPTQNLLALGDLSTFLQLAHLQALLYADHPPSRYCNTICHLQCDLLTHGMSLVWSSQSNWERITSKCYLRNRLS